MGKGAFLALGSELVGAFLLYKAGVIRLVEARRRESVYKCSVCGNYLTVRSDTLNGGRADMNYCPFCGGKVMHKGQDGGQDDV